MLEEAGFADGFSTTIWTDDNAERVNIATVVRNQLQEIGIDVTIEMMEWRTYLERIANGHHDMFILGWSAVTADADHGLFPLFHSTQFGSGGNRSFYKNERGDELLTLDRQVSDLERQKEIYLEVQEIIVDDVPGVFLSFGETLVGTRGEVNGFYSNPSGHQLFSNVYFE